MTNVRRKGHSAERKIITELNQLGPFKVGSSRLLSKYMDDQGVDIVDYPDSQVKFPFHIQVKSLSNLFNYRDLLDKFKLKDKPLVIVHEFTEKRGTRFFKTEDFVIMKKEDFYNLIKCK